MAALIILAVIAFCLCAVCIIGWIALGRLCKKLDEIDDIEMRDDY